MKTNTSRRQFLRVGAAALGAAALSRGLTRAWAQPQGANGDVRLAMIGLGRKGRDHLEKLQAIPGHRVVALCDVDPRVLAERVAALGRGRAGIFTATDARRVYERAEVDAVIVASPNHWHALHTVWACEAGKDVYVEKPVSHDVWEGEQMARAARRSGRIVQVGTQMRSDAGVREAAEFLRSGAAGRPRWAHALCFKSREGIGRRAPWYPDWLDYDHFCGPSPVVPLTRNELHYDWHWFWATGNGDLANIGIHEFDVARWLTGDRRAPRRILSLGGRFAFEDAGETPNTQMTVFDYGEVPIILENRVLSAKPGVRYMDHRHGVRQGVVVECEGGYYAGRYGGAFYDRSGRKVKEFAGEGGATHLKNFIDAVRSRRAADLACPMEMGRVSTSSCLYGNISYRLGRTATFADAQAAIEAVAPATGVLASLGEHLAVHGVDRRAPVLTLGPWLRPDEDLTEVASVDGADLAAARALVREPARPPYALADQPA